MSFLAFFSFFFFLLSIVQLAGNIIFPSLQRVNLRTSNEEEPKYILIAELNYSDAGYLTIPIQVGEPPQNFTLFFDMSDSFMFLPQQNAVNYTPITNFFDRNSDYFVDYGDEVFLNRNCGACSGTIVSSSFWLGGVNTLYYWILCKEIKMWVYPGGDGYIGFNRQISKESMTVLSSILYSYEKELPHKVMSLKPPTQDYPVPQLYVGNIHTDFYSTTVPLAHYNLINSTGPEYPWQMNNTSLVFGDYSYPFNVTNRTFVNTTLEFASYLATTMFPLEYVDVFLEYFPKDCHKEPLFDTVYVINCPAIDKVSNISLQLNNSLVLLPKVVFWRVNISSNEAVLFIPFRQDIKKIMLGVDFFWSYHILFDHEGNSVALREFNYGKVTNLDYVPPQGDFNFWLIFGIALGVIVFCFIVGAIVIWKRQNKNKSNTNLKEYEIGTIR